ncbi:hypothetical protein ACQP2K_18380 [Microbispora siamensis]
MDVTLKLGAKLPFAYDPATKTAWLGKDAVVTVQADGRLAAGAKPSAAFGILGVDLSAGSSLSLTSTFTATASDRTATAGSTCESWARTAPRPGCSPSPGRARRPPGSRSRRSRSPAPRSRAPRRPST